jgi:hypothetical protein
MSDRRVPGAMASDRFFRCPVPGCAESKVAYTSPLCPLHGVQMTMVTDPYSERRAKIRGERSES